MANQIKAILDGNLPQQSAIFDIAIKVQKRIHVLPVNVNSKYTIAHTQYQYAYDASKRQKGISQTNAVNWM